MSHRADLALVAGLAVACAIAAAPARAEHRTLSAEDLAYPGTIAVADGHGKVDVRIVYQAQEDCWRIAGAREGTPAPELDQPTQRHLYITVALDHATQTCQPSLTMLETRILIEDKPGRITLDIFFVDERGVYQRSQRHRIQRD
jgi:hypothetical protein